MMMDDPQLLEMDLIDDDFMAIYRALEENYLEYCVTRINRINLASRPKILNQGYFKHPQVMTLLVDSILQKATIVTRSLIDNGVDLNGTASILMSNDSKEIIHGVTPLWCAARSGNISLMKDLIERGARVNIHTRCMSSPLLRVTFIGSIECVEYMVNFEDYVNEYNRDYKNEYYEYSNESRSVSSNNESRNKSLMKELIERGSHVNIHIRYMSSPLLMASYIGSIECVEYLVENGAYINEYNEYSNSSLSVSSHSGNESIVKYLLNNGANVDAQNKYGLTAMHYAVDKNHINIIRLLISKGAKQLKDFQSVTPILYAAEKTHITIVDYLADFNLPQEKIDAYELLGASLLNSKENYNYEQGFSALLRAMEMRSNHQIPKQPYKKIAAYNNHIECETVQDLMNLRDFHEVLHMESLIIRERILGEKVPRLLLPQILYRASCYSDEKKDYESCIKLICHAIQIYQNNSFSAPVDLLMLLCIQEFCKMLNFGINIELSHLINVLSYAVEEYKDKENIIARNKDAEEEENMYQLIRIIVSMISITSLTLENECNLNHPLRRNLLDIIIKINKMNLRSRTNMTLLHMCLKYNIVLDGFIRTTVGFPHYKSMKLLLDCGADVNAIDDTRNTPLHYIIAFVLELRFMPYENDLNSQKIVKELLNAGAHLDVVNSNGVCPYNVSLTDKYPWFKKNPRNLTCLAACAIKYNIKKEYFVDKLPQAILNFIDLH